IDVTPKVIPSTATTRSAEARKIFAVSPNADLVALESGIGGIVLPVLVAMRLPAVAARVQRDLQRITTSRGDVGDDLRRNALVPDVQTILPRRNIDHREAPIRARLPVIADPHHLDLRHPASTHIRGHAPRAAIPDRL